MNIGELLFVNETGDATSLDFLHDSNGGKIIIQINGTMGGATITPYITGRDSLTPVELIGINYTTTGGYSLETTRGITHSFRITGSTGTTDITLLVMSQ